MTTATASALDLLEEFSQNRSSWIDIRRYPDSITLRRMIRLADFAAANPVRWQVIRLKYTCPEMTQQEIALALGISQQLVSDHLRPINLAQPDDYPEDDDY